MKPLEEFYKPALPGSRLMIAVMRLSATHCVAWSSEIMEYVAAGWTSTVACYATITLNLFCAGVYWKVEGSTAVSYHKASARKEIDYAKHILMACASINGVALSFLLNRNRSSLANVFNELQIFWLRLAQPRVRLCFVAVLELISMFIELTVRMFALNIHIQTYVPQYGPYFAYAIIPLIQWSFYVGKCSYTAIFIMMTFIYGTLADSVSSVLDKDTPLNPAQLTMTVESMKSIVIAFAEIVSPLSFTSLIQLVAMILLHGYMLIASGGPPPIIWERLLLVNGTFLVPLSVVGALYIGRHLQKKVAHLEKQVRMRSGRFTETPEKILCSITATLAEIPLPSDAMGVFTLEPGLFFSVAAFTLSYIAVFIQFKAIIGGDNTG